MMRNLLIYTGLLSIVGLGYQGGYSESNM